MIARGAILFNVNATRQFIELLIATTHPGPMAQDFYAAFRLGEDDRHIATVDQGGIALAAIKALQANLSAKDRQISDLNAKVARLPDLDAKIAQLETR